MTNIHFIDNYFMDIPHPITINLVGCGGTGSNMLTQLARIHHSLVSMNHPGLFVTAFDPDIISEANIGRQLYSPADLGINKAQLLITRINRFFGTQWQAMPTKYHSKLPVKTTQANFTISCVDTVASRVEIQKQLKKHQKENAHDEKKNFYWIDTGNTKDTGQLIMGTVATIKQPQSAYNTLSTVPNILRLYPQIRKMETEDLQGPSCSVEQALSKQDLFINSMIAQLTTSYFWSFIREGFTLYNGIFVNLSNFKTNPLPLKKI